MILNINKKLGLFILFAGLVSCGGGGGGGDTPAPNSVTYQTTPLNDNGAATGSSPITGMTVGINSGLTALNNLGTIYQSSAVSINWKALPLPGNIPVAITAVNSLGTLYAANALGDVYRYNNGWDNGLSSNLVTASLPLAGTQASLPTSMVVANNGNNIYLGNESGNLWYYNAASGNWSSGLSANGFSTSAGGITQVELDNNTTPQFLGVATGPYVWACRLSGGSTCSAWKNLVKEAASGGLYTDSTSATNPINAIGFYQSGSSTDYGYIGNAAGHVWRAIYSTATGKILTFDNMNSTFLGYNGSGAITSIAVDKNNTVYAGTANGQVLVWTVKTTAWSNITPRTNGSLNTSAITALTVYDNQTVYVSNATNQMWAVEWD